MLYVLVYSLTEELNAGQLLQHRIETNTQYFWPVQCRGEKGRGVDSNQVEISKVPYFEMKQKDGALSQHKKFYSRVESSCKVLSPQSLSNALRLLYWAVVFRFGSIRHPTTLNSRIVSDKSSHISFYK